MDSYTEITCTNWMTRLGGSFKGIITGLVLIAIASILLFWNEGRFVKRSKSLKEGQQIASSIDVNKLASVPENSLVHVTGVIKSNLTPGDPDFGIEAKDALRLKREVLIYQWIEKKNIDKKKKVGGSIEKTTEYTYQKEWSSKLHTSDGFKMKEGHQNPLSVKYAEFTQTVEKAQLGDLFINHTLLQKLNDFIPFDVPNGISNGQRIQENNKDHLHYVQYIGKGNPSSPQIGDLKIRYYQVPSSDYSLIGKFSNQQISSFLTKNSHQILLIKKGLHSKEDMFNNAHSSNSTTMWLLRLFGLLIMFSGWYMIGKPLVVVGDVIPIIGNIIGAGLSVFSGVLSLTLSLTIIAFAWLFYRPILAIGLFIVAVGIFIFFKRKNYRK